MATPAPCSAAVSAGRVEVGDAGLADDRDAPSSAEQAPGVAQHAVPDDHVVGRALERDGHPFHAPYSSMTVAATSSTVRPSVSTCTWAAAS